MKKLLQILLIIALGAFSLGITSCNANVNATDKKDTVELDFSKEALKIRHARALEIFDISLQPEYENWMIVEGGWINVKSIKEYTGGGRKTGLYLEYEVEHNGKTFLVYSAGKDGAEVFTVAQPGNKKLIKVAKDSDGRWRVVGSRY